MNYGFQEGIMATIAFIFVGVWISVVLCAIWNANNGKKWFPKSVPEYLWSLVKIAFWCVILAGFIKYLTVADKPPVVKVKMGALENTGSGMYFEIRGNIDGYGDELTSQ